LDGAIVLIGYKTSSYYAFFPFSHLPAPLELFISDIVLPAISLPGYHIVLSIANLLVPTFFLFMLFVLFG